MSMLTCQRCTKEIPDLVPLCTHCGAFSPVGLLPVMCIGCSILFALMWLAYLFS
jgi:hypothetical protein